jgi:uncharacterized protein (DUF488 family)
MFTSNYSKNGTNPNAISIAGKCPVWYKGKEYKILAPKYWFFKKYKENGDKEFYIEQYYKEVLSNLDPKKVYEELGDDAILLCWESAKDFCHRHLIAEWLEKELGVKIVEI